MHVVGVRALSIASSEHRQEDHEHKRALLMDATDHLYEHILSLTLDDIV